MAIARRVPKREEITKSISKNAALYGLSVEEYKSACSDWLGSEGYDGYGNAYEDVYEWLTITHGRQTPEKETGLMALGGLNTPLG
jgi:hypothetical protein